MLGEETRLRGRFGTQTDTMAKFNPPGNFNFSKLIEWPEWRQRFTWYHEASKLGWEDAAVQISSLIYAMGSEAEHIFKSFKWRQADDAKDYTKVVGKFDGYFVPKKNIIHERARFHMRNQGQGESVEAFVRTIHEVAEHCKFKDKSEQIRDRLVIGILDKELSERLQLQPDFTLDKAVTMARNSELVKSQIRDQQATTLDAVSTHRFSARRQTGRGKGGNSYNTTRKATTWIINAWISVVDAIVVMEITERVQPWDRNAGNVQG